MKKILIYILTSLLLSTACTTTKQPLQFHVKSEKNSIYMLKQGKSISTKELSAAVEKYPVIFVGDNHGSLKTHEFMDKLLQSLITKGYRIHLANEWFSPNHNKMLQRYTDGKITIQQLKYQRDWTKFTTLPWGLSSMLYERVRKSGGRLYGINLTRKERKKISSKLLSVMSNDERRFYDSIDTNVSAHKSLIEPFFENCHKIMPARGDESCQDRMYRVQVAWDSYMAKESAMLARRVLRSKKDKLIVFAGDMHMKYQLGIPLRFSRLSNQPFFTIVNHSTSKKETIGLDVGLADAVFIY